MVIIHIIYLATRITIVCKTTYFAPRKMKLYLVLQETLVTAGNITNCTVPL